VAAQHCKELPVANQMGNGQCDRFGEMGRLRLTG
jgi:hypothetical protein